MNIFSQRRTKFTSLLEDSSVFIIDSGEAKHITTDQFFEYVPHRNFYYLTGLNEENCRLLILKNGDVIKELLFIEETTEYMRQWVGEKISKEEASKITGIPTTNIHYLDKFDSLFRSMMTYARGFGVKPPKNLYLDLYRYKVNKKPESLLQFESLLDNYRELQIKNANEHLSYLRMFKSEDEINDIKKAIDITRLGLNRIMDSLKTRTNEHQVSADYVHEITLNGSKGISFNTIAASGLNATVLHYEDNNSDMKKEDLFLCDLGCLWNNYGSDITRTYPISGTYSARQKELYEIVLDVNKQSIEYVKPGITWGELNKFAKDLLAEKCIEIGLIKEQEEISKYYYHTIGHFLGLDVHDIGQYNLKLEEGMVITIEPGLYIKEEGIGIRIEDDILITKEGSINLSKDIIKEIKDIEEYMN